jgi:hypothetical protein
MNEYITDLQGLVLVIHLLIHCKFVMCCFANLGCTLCCTACHTVLQICDVLLAIYLLIHCEFVMYIVLVFNFANL